MTPDYRRFFKVLRKLYNEFQEQSPYFTTSYHYDLLQQLTQAVIDGDRVRAAQLRIAIMKRIAQNKMWYESIWMHEKDSNKE